MRQIYLIFIFLLLVGCEVDTAERYRTVATFVPTLSTLGSGADTRVDNTQWTSTDVVGIGMSNTQGTLPTAFSSYKAADPGSSTVLTPVSGADALYFIDEQTRYFTAFCPYDDTKHTPSSGSVSYTLTDQNTAAKMEAVDLVYANDGTGSKSNSSVTLGFTHKLSKLTVNVIDGRTTRPATTVGLTIKDVPTTATCALATGAITASGTGDITPLPGALSGATLLTATAIVAPHLASAYSNGALSFTIDDSVNTPYTSIHKFVDLDPNFEFKSGTAYALTFTLTDGEGLKIVGDTYIVGWNDGVIAWDGGTVNVAPTITKDGAAGSYTLEFYTTGDHLNPSISFADEDQADASVPFAGFTAGSLDTGTLQDNGQTKWTYTYTLANYYGGSGTQKKGYININLGNLKLGVELTQTGLAAVSWTLPTQLLSAPNYDSTKNGIYDGLGAGISNGSISFTSNYLPVIDDNGMSTFGVNSTDYTLSITGTGSYTLNYTLKANALASAGGVQRSGSFTVTAGDQTITVNVKQEPLTAVPYYIQPWANCYIVNAATTQSNTLTISMEQALRGWRWIRDNGGLTSTDFSPNLDLSVEVANLEALLADPTKWKVELLWRTWSGVLRFNIGSSFSGQVINTNSAENTPYNDYVVTLTGLNGVTQNGNAVIALKSTADNTIWWTWHLWFTDYNPDGSGTDIKGQVHTYISNAFKAGGIYATNNQHIMDRNLGATGSVLDDKAIPLPTDAATAVPWYGLLYQWGKKDPYTSSGNATNTIDNAMAIYDKDGNPLQAGATTYWTANSKPTAGFTVPASEADGFPKFSAGSSVSRLIDAIRMPYVYFHSGLNSSWTHKHHNTLWGSDASNPAANTGKTAFDPCPPGWRVPIGGESLTQNPWAGFADGNANTNPIANSGQNAIFSWIATTNATGRQYTGKDKSGKNISAWYPASGYRYNGSGAFNLVGTGGYYWAAAITGDSGYRLGFNSSSVYPRNSNSRANGFPVRCVQE